MPVTSRTVGEVGEFGLIDRLVRPAAGGRGRPARAPVTTPPWSPPRTRGSWRAPTCSSRAGTSGGTGPSRTTWAARPPRRTSPTSPPWAPCRPRCWSAWPRRRTCRVDWALALADGLREECETGRRQRGRRRRGALGDAHPRRHGAGVAGGPRAGDALGRAPGDVVAVAGRLGWAAAGLAVLSRGFRSPRVLVEAHRRPSPPYGAGTAGREAGRDRHDRRERRAGAGPRSHRAPQRRPDRHRVRGVRGARGVPGHGPGADRRPVDLAAGRRRRPCAGGVLPDRRGPARGLARGGPGEPRGRVCSWTARRTTGRVAGRPSASREAAAASEKPCRP